MNASLAGIRAVAFDVDGTLYTNRSMYLASAGLVLANLRLYRAFGHAREQVRRDPPQPSELWRRTVALTAAKLGAPEVRTEQRIRAVVYDAWEKRLRRVRLVRGLLPFLQWLDDRGLATAVLSDFPVTRKLVPLGLDDRFPVRVSAEDVGRLKPDPAPFHALAEALGLEPARILYIGNSYRNDVLGAAGVGMPVVHLACHAPRGTPAVATVRAFDILQRWMAQVLAE